MATITFEILGKAPGVLMNNPAGMQAEEDKQGLVRGSGIPKKAEEAEAKCYRLPSGVLYLPALMFRSSMLNAASGKKIGKKSAKALLSAALFLEDGADICTLHDPETGEAITEYEIDSRRAVVQRNGVVRSRALIPKWSVELAFFYDREIIPQPDVLKLILEEAGKFIGVGDFRPQKQGPFGRFSVTGMRDSKLD